MAIDRSKAEAVLNQARRTPAGLRYFFDQLKSADWIEPLRALGVFKTPAPVLREEGYISFPDWPESKYLARMAAQAPRLVKNVINGIPPTDNFSVHQDFIEAALNMPAKMATAIAAIEANWIDKQPTLFALYPEKVGELIGYLAASGQSKAALQLARSVLAVSPDERTSREDYPFPPDPVAKFDNWHYQRILFGNIVTKLVPAAPMDTLRLVADLLQTALEIRNTKYGEATAAKEDFSSIWRPNIEHERMSDVMQTLVTGVRGVATAVCALGEQSELVAVEELEKREWRVFKRLAMYVLGVCPHTPVQVLESVIRERSNFERQGTFPEFDLLLKNGFQRVSENARRHVFTLIDEGPNRVIIGEQWKKATGNDLTDEEFQRHAARWRQGWLDLLMDQLPSERREQLQQITEKYGKVESEPQASSWVGPTSPLSGDDLKRMSVAELIKYLREFRPTNNWASPSPEGFSRSLSHAVGLEPSRFAETANAFRSLHPTYVRGFVDGLRTGLKQGKTFEWTAVLSLCVWVVEQPRDEVESLGEDSDPNWGWTRKEIGGLLSDGLAKNSLKVEDKEKVWQILQVLVEDPDPSPERESGYTGQKHFPGMLALNTVRGLALDAVVQFGLWTQLDGGNGLDEVGPTLDRHLDLSVDPSYAVREVCGRLFPWLVKLDQQWAKDRIKSVFPPDRPDHRWIAWENYVLFCWPYDAVLPLLEQEYSWAIAQIGEARSSEAVEAERHMADHLLTFYWRGLLSLQSSLLSEFFERAPDELRQHALEFIGRSLRSEGNVPISIEVLERLRILWEARLAHAAMSNNGKELAAFGWWFISGKFDEEWRCNQLLAALRRSGSVDAEWEVAKALIPLTNSRPLYVLEVLRLLVEADKQGWSIYGWQDEARQILADAFSLRRPEVNAAAKEVVDLLVTKGHFQYRQLLNG